MKVAELNLREVHSHSSCTQRLENPIFWEQGVTARATRRHQHPLSSYAHCSLNAVSQECRQSNSECMLCKTRDSEICTEAALCLCYRNASITKAMTTWQIHSRENSVQRPLRLTAEFHSVLRFRGRTPTASGIIGKSKLFAEPLSRIAKVQSNSSAAPFAMTSKEFPEALFSCRSVRDEKQIPT